MAVDHTFKWSGFARGLSDSFAQAMQRRLEQQYRQDSQVDLLSYLPDQVRQTLYPDRQSLLVDPSQVSPLMGHTMSAYDRVSRPQESQMPMGALVAYQQAVQSGNWEPFLESWGHLNVPSSDMARLAMMPQYTATAVQRGVETQDMQSQLAWEDTPLTKEYADMLGMPQWAGMTPRQIQGLQQIQTGVHAQESHEDARLMAALERAAKALGIEVTQQELQQSAAMFGPLLRQEQARADQMEFEAQKAPEQHELNIQRILQEIQNLAAQGQLTSLQAQLMSQALPYYVRQEEARAGTMESEARRSQIETDLLATFGRQKEQLAIQAAELGIALDEASLDRLIQTTGPVVAKAVADAQLAQTEAATKESLAPVVLQRAQADLYGQLLSNQLSWLDYETGIRLMPIIVDQALEDLEMSRVQRSSEELRLELDRRFEAQRRDQELRALQIANARAALGAERDEAELELLLATADSVIAKAAAEASLAQTEAQTREALAPIVIAQAEEELQNMVLRNEIDSVKAEEVKALLPINVERALAELESVQISNRAAEFQLMLDQEFALEKEIEGLKALRLNNLRQLIGLEMDQAELDRYVKLTDPLVRKAVAEALAAETDAMFKQTTFETAVAIVEAELDAKLLANEVTQQEYDIAKELAPYQVQQAAEDLLKIQLQNEAQQLENEYARGTMEYRFMQLLEEIRLLEMQVRTASTEFQEAQIRLALAERTAPAQADMYEVELEQAKTNLLISQQQLEALQKQQEALQGLDPEDRDFAFKLYQVEIDPFRGQGVWIPPFADYVMNMMSREQPMDWNHYVWNYDAEMRQRIGPPPEGDVLDFPWMSQEWQNLYKKELDGYIATLPDRQWSLRQAPLFPSIAVFYGNYMSGNPMDPEELIRRYNDGTIPQYIYDIAFGRPVSGTGTSRGRMDELISDLPNIFPGLSSNEDILSVLQSGHPSIQPLMAKIEEIYGVTGDELIAELRRR